MSNARRERRMAIIEASTELYRAMTEGVAPDLRLSAFTEKLQLPAGIEVIQLSDTEDWWGEIVYIKIMGDALRPTPQGARYPTVKVIMHADGSPSQIVYRDEVVESSKSILEPWDT